MGLNLVTEFDEEKVTQNCASCVGSADFVQCAVTHVCFYCCKATRNPLKF